MTNELQPMPDDWSQSLAVVAHPDDMEFGASGAVAAWTSAGKTVSYLMITRGEAGIDGMAPEEALKVREAEQRESARIVGVPEVGFLDHRDGVIEHGLRLRRDIAAAIRRSKPELVIGFNYHEFTTTGKWNSPDHRNAGRALLDAVTDAGNRWIFSDLGLEPWGGVRYVAIAGSPQCTHAVDVSGTLDKAVASLEAHRTYLEGLGPAFADVRAPLEAYARMTAERFGGCLAIPFELLKR